MSTSGSSTPLCLQQYCAATFINSVSPFFSFCFIELCYLGWLSADGQTLLASMENLMLYSEGKGTKISSFFIRYAFGVLYKTMVIVTDGQLLEAGEGKTDQRTFFLVFVVS